MQRCLDLAIKGIGQVEPNPMVGCVIVHQGMILCEGFHARFGGHHAEAEALSRWPESFPEDTILYVNLEPCNHYGKTPPCSDAIIARGIKHVVVGCLDPNPKVAREGVKRLVTSGVEVKVGVLEDRCLAMNKAFIHRFLAGESWVTMKVAQTENGGTFYDEQVRIHHLEQKKVSGWSSQWVNHRLRSRSHAILIGAATLMADAPQLNDRIWNGNEPQRLILGDISRRQGNSIPGRAGDIWIPETPVEHAEREVMVMKEGENWRKSWYERGWYRVMVEGGIRTINKLIMMQLIDESLVWQSEYLGGISEGEAVLGVEKEWAGNGYR